MKKHVKKLIPKFLLLSVVTTFALAASLPTPLQAFPGMQQEAGQANSQGAAAQGPAHETPSGKVVETMSAAGYTYVCLESGGKKVWGAVPKTEVKVGDQVALIGAMPMQNFTSKSLNQTFDVIYFGQNLTPITVKK
jgi:hypothetical protein